MEKWLEDTIAKVGRPGYLFGLVIVGVVLSIPLIIYRGFAIATLWVWFVIPLGLPAISLMHAVGIALTVNVIITQPNETPNKAKPFLPLVKSFVTSSLGLLVGWIVVSFM